MYQRLAGDERAALPGSTPPAVHPKPLLGMLAYPSFDDRCDHLHRGRDFDLAIMITRKPQRIRQLQPVTAAGKPHRSRSVNRTIKLTRQACQCWVRLAASAEKTDLDTAGAMLIDKHSHADTVAQCAPDPQRGTGACCNHGAPDLFS